MSYDYRMQRPNIFTEDGVRMLLTMRDKARAVFDVAKCVRMEKIMTTGDTWDMLACADYMVERGDMHEITGRDVAGQNRIFVRGSLR